MTLFTTMSSRGQIVLPKKIRTELKLDEGTPFIVFSDADNILLKPVKMPCRSEFSGLLHKAREWARAAGMTEEDVADAIKAVRKAKK